MIQLFDKNQSKTIKMKNRLFRNIITLECSTLTAFQQYGNVKLKQPIHLSGPVRND